MLLIPSYPWNEQTKLSLFLIISVNGSVKYITNTRVISTKINLYIHLPLLICLKNDKKCRYYRLYQSNNNSNVSFMPNISVKITNENVTSPKYTSVKNLNEYFPDHMRASKSKCAYSNHHLIVNNNQNCHYSQSYQGNKQQHLSLNSIILDFGTTRRIVIPIIYL